MKKRNIVIVFISLLSFNIFAQTKEIIFPLFDGSFEYMTMKQCNDNYFSFNQLFLDTYFSSFIFDTEKKQTSLRVLEVIPIVSLNVFLFAPMTHEEGHRSILTAKGIGAISQPIFKPAGFLKGVAYVKGVSDLSLANLRDTDFPNFIRMHTAGIESEYSLMQKEYKYMALGLDGINKNLGLPVLFVDYYSRIMDIFIYSSTCLFDSFNQDPVFLLREEKNEYERDIVGHDIYGMVHHLYHPSETYKRYFNYSDLSTEEQKYVRNIAYKNLINFPILSLLGVFLPSDETGFLVKFGNNCFIGVNTGYSLAPFGDYIDENFFIRIDNLYKNPLRFVVNFRQQKNKNTWFPAFGVEMVQLHLSEYLSINASGSIWWQPEDLSFTTEKSFIGGSVEIGCNIFPFKKNENSNYEFGVNLNCLYKTKGFKQEVMSMDEAFVFTAGISLRY